jgi:hypothetical protein
MIAGSADSGKNIDDDQLVGEQGAVAAFMRIARLIAAGHQLISMRESEVNLETAFLEITKGSLGRPKAVANPAATPAPSA